MNKEKTIELLNTLVMINNDRIEGYKTAGKNTKDRDLKTLFSKFKLTSKKCRRDLVSKIKKLGGKVAVGTKVPGLFFRVWSDVKSTLTVNDSKSILDLCEQGEEKVLETYRYAFDDASDHLTAGQQKMVKNQYSLIKAELGKIRLMRDNLVKASKNH
ncbi:PA2169 family four-helix-bundle protein [Rhodohalobacter sp.]|uniref:PA2169 family four-helix-bundle protein n=1 Tax=Rhodohalobacter sp. TaxID=1974210 RepID=UPI002ACE5971|nr:PA2169 family four-helix-bundle protein [Rhodohalobacter sp.]MDZ7755815.1 PA2169 family four-helix-bundle protein [Rhodohalobacter sp.]